MTEIKLDDDFDFGFSTRSEDEILNDYSTSERLTQMYNLILPLLNNLAQDADEKPHIYWPNRKVKIEQFKKRLDKIYNNT